MTYEDTIEDDDDESEHVSVYEDDATSLASGTVRHDNQSFVDNNDFGSTLAAALAGQVDFDQPQRAYRARANTGG